MLRGTRAIWLREMRKWKRNRVQLVSSLLLPVLFLIVVGNAYSGSFSHVPVAVLNQDSYPLGAVPGEVYAQVLQNSTALTVVSANISVQDAMMMVDNGQLAGFILIPVNFSRGLVTPFPIGSSKINVTVDNTNLMVAQALSAIAAQALNETLNDQRVKNWFFNITHTTLRTGSYINTVDQYSSGYSFIDFLAPGILAMTVLFTSLFAAGMPIILDREVGYFDMLLSTPAKRSEVVLGFTLAGVTKVVAQATFVLIIAVLIGIRMALNPLSLLYIYVLVILLALGFVGISIALSVKIEITAFQFVNGLINFPVFFLSGAFYPIQSLPDWLRAVVLVNPMTYAVDGLRGVMIKGTSLVNVLPDVVVVGIFALLMVLLGNLALYMSLSGKSVRMRHRSKGGKVVEGETGQAPRPETRSANASDPEENASQPSSEPSTQRTD
ncbi:MAG: ABC transporter permease [Promethearchaeati archaeon SRVP18_Atabeyarchaeia-1]